ncbi:MAG: FeoC-like transcriptional regulator [Candidatus Nanohaloarchaea archaeon]
MNRANKVMEKVEEMIDESEKPSVQRLSTELGMHEADVHGCLNLLEREGRIETYTKKLFGDRTRFVALKR